MSEARSVHAGRRRRARRRGPRANRHHHADAGEASRGRAGRAPARDLIPAHTGQRPRANPSASSPIPAAVPEVPAWALTIADELFRKALLHIEKHGSIDEAELTSLVGGTRRARVFARDLDTWRATLPFGVEASTASGIKIYRR